MHKAKHVPTSFADGRHLGENRQVVNDEGHLCTLLPGQILSVTQDPEPCDVSCCVCIEGVHQPGRWTERQIKVKHLLEPVIYEPHTCPSHTDLFCWVEPCSAWPPDKPVQHPPEWRPTLSYSISLAETERKMARVKHCPNYNMKLQMSKTLTMSNHWCTATATCVPRGLVRTSTSPGTALSGL